MEASGYIHIPMNKYSIRKHKIGMEPNQSPFKIETKSNAVRSILDDSNGHVWIGTDHKGVFIYDYVNDNLVNLLNTPMSSTSLASNRINTIYRDDSGVIWLGNFKKGVSYYHESFHELLIPSIKNAVI